MPSFASTVPPLHCYVLRSPPLLHLLLPSPLPLFLPLPPLPLLLAPNAVLLSLLTTSSANPVATTWLLHLRPHPRQLPVCNLASAVTASPLRLPSSAYLVVSSSPLPLPLPLPLPPSPNHVSLLAPLLLPKNPLCHSVMDVCTALSIGGALIAQSPSARSALTSPIVSVASNLMNAQDSVTLKSLVLFDELSKSPRKILLFLLNIY